MRKQTGTAPSVSIDIDAGITHKVLYDSSTIFPVISDLRPHQSGVDGLSSSSFSVIGAIDHPESVQIGAQTVPITRIDRTKKRVYFAVPPVNASEVADVFLTWPGGVTSNTLKFNYIGGPVEDPVGFKFNIVKEEMCNTYPPQAVIWSSLLPCS